MEEIPSESVPRLDWGVAWKAKAGEDECGDAWLVEPVRGGVLAAAVDGLGHGPDAAESARRALAAIRDAAADELTQILHGCHRALVGCRGVAVSMAQIEPDRRRLTWEGVGDVEGVVVSWIGGPDAPVSRSLLVRGGVVGYEIPRLRPTETDFRPGDLLVFTTDGVRHGFAGELREGEGAQRTADRILATHAGETDDALVLVLQMLGDH